MAGVETDALYLWQDDSRRINAMLDEVESWWSRLTPASFQELVEDLMRRCIRAPKDVAVAPTNSKGDDQLTNSKGDEIFYPVNDERDRQWARRLEWVIGHHLDRAEDDLEELHADNLAVLRESREAHERKYDQEHIAELNKRLKATNKSLLEFRAHGYCK